MWTLVIAAGMPAGDHRIVRDPDISLTSADGDPFAARKATLPALFPSM
jgi:hypothetical protein